MFCKHCGTELSGQNEICSNCQLLRNNPDSNEFYTEFEAQIYVRTKSEGGRHVPFFKGYKPQFNLRSAEVIGEIILPKGQDMVSPGETIVVKVVLTIPVEIKEAEKFTIIESGHTVGIGVVVKINK